MFDEIVGYKLIRVDGAQGGGQRPSEAQVAKTAGHKAGRLHACSILCAWQVRRCS